MHPVPIPVPPEDIKKKHAVSCSTIIVFNTTDEPVEPPPITEPPTLIPHTEHPWRVIFSIQFNPTDRSRADGTRLSPVPIPAPVSVTNAIDELRHTMLPMTNRPLD
jgi:hypothetical protein